MGVSTSIKSYPIQILIALQTLSNGTTDRACQRLPYKGINRPPKGHSMGVSQTFKAINQQGDKARSTQGNKEIRLQELQRIYAYKKPKTKSATKIRAILEYQTVGLCESIGFIRMKMYGIMQATQGKASSIYKTIREASSEDVWKR